MSSTVNICGRHTKSISSYKKFGVRRSGLDHCSRIQAAGSASLVMTHSCGHRKVAVPLGRAKEEEIFSFHLKCKFCLLTIVRLDHMAHPSRLEVLSSSYMIQPKDIVYPKASGNGNFSQHPSQGVKLLSVHSMCSLLYCCLTN